MGKAKGGRSGTDSRKLENMINDLRTIKAELLPDERDKLKEAELKSFDDFQRKKHELNGILEKVRKNVDRLIELRKKLGEDGRDTTTIRIQSENNKDLKDAIQVFNELKKILQKDELKKGKKKLEEKELADRRHLAMLLGEDIKELTNQNSKVKVTNTEEETAMQARVDKRKAREEDARARREAKRKGRKGKGKDDIDDDEFKAVGPVSEQEQAFEEKVAQNMADQDVMLAEISSGLDELKDLATEANKQLTIQAAMLDQVENKMDETIGQFKSANSKLKTLLDESGGMSRWCPIIICLVLLLGLIGYITKMI